MAMRDYEELVETLRSEADGFLMADVPDRLMADSLNEAADAIEELCRENESLANSVNEAAEILRNRSPKWISVEERLPEPYVDVLVYCEWVGMSGTTYHEIQLTSLKELRNQGYTPIAWMPLPEPPKEATDA